MRSTLPLSSIRRRAVLTPAAVTLLAFCAVLSYSLLESGAVFSTDR